MAQYPVLRIFLRRIAENVQQIVRRADLAGVSVTGVTKCAAGNPEIARIYIENGIASIGDSRIQNLEKMKDIPAEKWLIRIPMASEVRDVVALADVSLNSSIETLRLLDAEAVKQKKRHGAVLMVDAGDLREGWFVGDGTDLSEENAALAAREREAFLEAVREIAGMEGVYLKGIGVNSTCFGSVIPTEQTFTGLFALKKEAEEITGKPVDVISGGNSSSYYLLESGRLPAGVNNLRLGESVLFGRDTSYLEEYSYLNQNCFELVTQIVECKEKPTYPIGEIGVNSFGEKIYYEDKGIRKRAIIAIGKQDVIPDHIVPMDPGITIEGASSDHMILDVTDAKKDYQVGDLVSFTADYAGILWLCTSDYVRKEIVE